MVLKSNDKEMKGSLNNYVEQKQDYILVKLEVKACYRLSLFGKVPVWVALDQTIDDGIDKLIEKNKDLTKEKLKKYVAWNGRRTFYFDEDLSKELPKYSRVILEVPAIKG